MGTELTIPEVAQSIILTRTAMKSSSMPEGEELDSLGKTGATLAIHLSVRNLREIERVLTPYYGADCPVAIVYRASWPDERILRGTLGTIEGLMDEAISRTALILVGPALGGETDVRSCLYSTDYDRRYRPQSADSPWSSYEHRDD